MATPLEHIARPERDATGRYVYVETLHGNITQENLIQHDL